MKEEREAEFSADVRDGRKFVFSVDVREEI